MAMEARLRSNVETEVREQFREREQNLECALDLLKTRQSHAHNHPSKSQNEEELQWVYACLSEYRKKTRQCLDVLVRNQANGRLSVAPSLAVRLLCAQNIVGKEYKRLCLEVRQLLRST